MNRTKLVKEDFRLDADRRKNQQILDDHENGQKKDSVAELSTARMYLEESTRRLRNIQRELYGWRNVSQIYGENLGLGSIEFLKREMLRLEGQEINFEKTLKDYENEVTRLENKIKELQAKASSNIGYVPTSKEIQGTQDELLDLHRKASTANAGLPLVKSQLEKRRKKLAALEKKVESAKKFNDGKVYSSPSAELAGRVQDYKEKHGVNDDVVAMRAILESDPILADAYINI